MGWWPLGAADDAPRLGQGGGGADSGQAANPESMFGTISGYIADGFTGAASDANNAAAAWAGKAREKVTERMAGGLPGYGELWQIGADGVEVTRAGKIVAAAVVVGLGLLLLGGGKRGRW